MTLNFLFSLFAVAGGRARRADHLRWSLPTDLTGGGPVARGAVGPPGPGLMASARGPDQAWCGRGRGETPGGRSAASCDRRPRRAPGRPVRGGQRGCRAGEEAGEAACWAEQCLDQPECQPRRTAGVYGSAELRGQSEDLLAEPDVCSISKRRRTPARRGTTASAVAAAPRTHSHRLRPDVARHRRSRRSATATRVVTVHLDDGPRARPYSFRWRPWSRASTSWTLPLDAGPARPRRRTGPSR